MTAKASRLVTIGTVATGAAGQGATLVSGVLAARILGVLDRGHLALLILVPLILSVIGSAGLPVALTFYIARDRPRGRAIVMDALPSASALAAAATFVHWIALAIVVHNAPERVQFAGAMSAALVPALIAQMYGQGVLQGLRRFRAFNVVRLLPALFYAVGVAVLFGAHAGTLPLVMSVWVIASALAALVACATAWRALPKSVETATPVGSGRLLAFGIRGFLGSVSPIETFQLDQLAVAIFLSPVALGLYAVAVAFTGLPRLLAQSVGMVAYPEVAHRNNREEARATMWRFVWLTAGIVAVIVVSLTLTAGYLVPLLVGRAFAGAVPVIRILLAGSLFLAVRRVLVDGARGAGHPTVGTVAELASWVVLLPAMGVLTPLFGIDGAASAMVISACASLGVLLFAMKRVSRRLPGPVVVDGISSSLSP